MPRIVDHDVEMIARDGTVLRADIYRPNTRDPVPVLLQRTPYNKALCSESFARAATERGYALIVQDCRGCWASDGETIAFRGEKTDGYDAVQWAAHQPWADGNVGMTGSSYVGYTQLMAAAARPPALRAIFPIAGFHDLHTVFHPGGASALGLTVSWGLGAHAQIATARHSGSEAEQAAVASELNAAISALETGETFHTLPIVDVPVIGRDGAAPFLEDMVTHSRAGTAFWREISAIAADIQVPAYHAGGWYDIFAPQTLAAFSALQAAGRSDQKLLMGPWLHGPLSSRVGEVDFTSEAVGDGILNDALQFRWFDYWLKGIDNGMRDSPAIRIFVMGAKVWRDEKVWPPARAKETACYLHSNGDAAAPLGSGSLSFGTPGQEPHDTFVYDPHSPVPTRGGRNCCHPTALPAGAYDQRAIEARPDVLVYTSARLDQDLEITGPVRLRLWAATNTPDTDFTAKLVDVDPEGYARNVCDGIVRTRYRISPSEPHPVEPNAAFVCTIELGPTSNLFRAGHRIRLEVSSSNFPQYDRNANSGGPIGLDTELRPAIQTIFHDATRPSHLALPIMA